MNAEEAKFILSAARPDGSDDADPEIAQALRLVEKDTELKAWYEDMRQFDRAVSERLQTVSPPAELKDSILAGTRVSKGPAWSRRPVLTGFLTAAAALVLGVGGWIFVSELAPASAGSVEKFQSDMLTVIQRLDRLDFRSNDPGDIAEWLRAQGTPVGFEIPAGAGRHELLGCKLLEWKGRRATLICFDNPDEEGMPGLHLVVVEAAAITGFEAGHSRVFPGAEWSSAVWRKGDRIFLVAARGKHADARELLPLS